jgi:hypothetical protein
MRFLQDSESRFELFGATLEFLGMLQQALAREPVRDFFREPARLGSAIAKRGNVRLEPGYVFFVAHSPTPPARNVGY